MKTPMRKSSTLILSILTLALLAVPSFAQETYVLSDDSTIRVDGASNKSDWSVEATAFSGSFTVEEDMPLEGTLSIAVRDLKSGRSLIMDRLMHQSFEAATYPDIVFTLDSVAATEAEGEWDMGGELQIHGQSQPVTVRLVQQPSVDRTLRYVGSHELKMTDFGMKPPTAMFGSLHTRDEVTVEFDLYLASTCEEECDEDSSS